jgi:hypothetical protein
VVLEAGLLLNPTVPLVQGVLVIHPLQPLVKVIMEELRVMLLLLEGPPAAEVGLEVWEVLARFRLQMSH